MIFLQKFLTNWRAQRGKFLSISSIFHDFSSETLCVDEIISQPRGILCVEKIRSPDPGILCVDKIESPENPQQPGGANVAANVGANVGANPSKPSPGQDPRVGWYCYRATHSRRHISHTPTESAQTGPKISFGKKSTNLPRIGQWDY